MFEIGFTYRDEYFNSIMACGDQIDFLEIIPDGIDIEDGSDRSRRIRAAADKLPFTAHSIELSIASHGDDEYLHRLGSIIAFLKAMGITHYSDHLAYTRAGGLNCDAYVPPLYGVEDASNVASRCERVIEALDEIGADFALENVANTAMATPDAPHLEGRFMRALAERVDLGFILNIDSLLISSSALGVTPQALLATYPVDRIDAVTIVPADAMNVVMNRQYGVLVEREALDVLEDALQLINPSRVVIQVRYPHNTLDAQLPYIDRLKAIRAAMPGPAAQPKVWETRHAAQ